MFKLKQSSSCHSYPTQQYWISGRGQSIFISLVLVVVITFLITLSWELMSKNTQILICILTITQNSFYFITRYFESN